MHLIIILPNGNVSLCIKVTLWTHSFVHTRHPNAMIPTLKHTLAINNFSQNDNYE